MKLSGHKLFYAVLIVSVLMVNPPIVFWFNHYCVEHPLLFGWPTMYIWLEFWFLVMIADFIVAAYKLKAWDCRQDRKPIVPVQRPEL